MIPYGKQDITQLDIDAVVDVLKSDYLTQGLQVPLFEKIVADYCGAQYPVAVHSATSALHVACLALGLGQGDWLWTSPTPLWLQLIVVYIVAQKSILLILIPIPTICVQLHLSKN
jgi:dTDP-4-amino-4,6-dideoxygalactose transaminase